jgi:transposase
MAHLPPQQPRPRKARVDPYLSRLVERWETGNYTVAELYRDLVADGYSHSYDSVYRQLVRYLPEGRKKRFMRSTPSESKNQEISNQLSWPPILARQAMFLFLRQAEKLEPEEKETLAVLRSLHPEVDQAYEFIQQFVHMLHTRTGERLDGWLDQVRASQIRELQGFIAGVKRDKAAVRAGLTLPQNNDHVA